MIGIFVLLILSQAILGDRKTKSILALVDIPVRIFMLDSSLQLLIFFT